MATPPGRPSHPSNQPSLLPTALKHRGSVNGALIRGTSVAASPSNTRPSKSSPERWSEPPPGSVGSPPLGRRSSVTFSPEIRRNARLSPLSPKRTGSGVPLVRGASGILERSPNRCANCWASSAMLGWHCCKAVAVGQYFAFQNPFEVQVANL